eukprot:gene18848-60030_t
MGAASALASRTAELLADYDVDAAQDVVDGGAGGQR